MRLSPHDILIPVFHVFVGEAEIGLGHFDAAIDEFHKAIDSGYGPFFAYTNLSAAYAQAGRMDEAKAAVAEARRLNPKLTVKWMIAHMPNCHLGSKASGRRGWRKNERDPEDRRDPWRKSWA